MDEKKIIYDLGIDQNFLKHDMQLNQNVIINGRNAYNNFAADLIDYAFTAPEVSKTLYRNLGGNSFNINTFALGDSFLTLNFYVGGTSLTNAQINVNHLLDEFTNKVAIVKLDETNFEYECVIDTHTVEYTGVKCYYLVSITANAIKRLQLKEVDFTRLIDFTGDVDVELSVFNEGVTFSGARIVVLFNSRRDGRDDSGTFAFTIGYKNDKGEDVMLRVANPRLNVAPDDESLDTYFKEEYFIIDGINASVEKIRRYCLSGEAMDTNYSNVEWEEHVANALLDVDIIDFPFFGNGFNNITFYQDEPYSISKVMISFYPKFII